jgi:predicted DCC family thiol-disulfide oxidoreductase YuxK
MMIKNLRDKAYRSFALLRRMALTILRTKDQTPKRSIKRKLRRAAMDNDYLLSLLA